MKKWLVVIAVLIIAIIVGISLYLQPNDLSKCGKTPGTTVDCQPVDAIVAISGGDTDARANWAISLYKNGWSDTLIFSGAAQDKSGPSNAAVMKDLAIADGVPSASIYIDENSATTGQNAKNTQTIFSQHDIKKVILVTSGYHQRRASLEFNKQAKGVVILNSPAQNDKDWSFWWWTTLRGWWLAVSEIVKIIIFYIVGIWS
ncbi:MAG TPA: YdcF family protein [Candidatus Saccharimonadales bacterium]|nr:YdcF family protein [Candidatus Saccharimonadales bacterium]